MPIEQPIVVRLDGTNAEEGRRILQEAAPPNVHTEPTMLDGGEARGGAGGMTDVWSERAQLYASPSAPRGRRPRPARRVGGGRGDGARRRDRRRSRGAAAARGGAPGRDHRPRSGDAAGRHLPCRGAARSPTGASTSSRAARPLTTSPTCAAALREMARVAAIASSWSTTLNMGDEAEEAERLRDPSHVRNYTEAEWRALFEGAGLADRGRPPHFAHDRVRAWLARDGCEGGRRGARARALRRPDRGRQAHARPDRAQGRAELDGDHRRHARRGSSSRA